MLFPKNVTCQELTPGSVRATNHYDANGNLERAERNYIQGGIVTTHDYEYDERNQRTKLTQPAPGVTPLAGMDAEVAEAPITEYAYDTLGNLERVTNPREQITEYEYDKLHRRTKVTEPAAQTHGNPVTVTQYYADGRVHRITAPGNRVTEYEYDDLGRRTVERLPQVAAGTRTIVHGYDLRDNVTSVEDSGRTTYYAYDERDRIKSTTGPDPGGGAATATVAYEYNAAGEQLSVMRLGSTLDT